MCDFVTLYIALLENTGSLSYVNLLIYDTFNYKIFLKITLIILPMISSEKVVSIKELSDLW